MRVPTSLARAFLAFFAVSLIILPTVAAAASLPSISTFGHPPAALDRPIRLAPRPPTPVNESVRQENPDAITERGDLAAVRTWLAGHMAIRLESCVVKVGLGETNVCELDTRYPDWLHQYVDVADHTSGTGDDHRAKTWASAASEARSYATQVSTFRETYRGYRQARRQGDEARARTLARQLVNQGSAVQRTGGELVDASRVLEADGADLSGTRASVNQTRANVSQIVSSVETEQFVRTRLNATLSSTTISFTAPGVITGQLVTENGTPVANRTIKIAIRDRSFAVRTDETGAFSVTYRPTTLPVSTSSLTIRYVPRNETVYLGSNTSVPVSVTAVTPAVTVAVAPRTARYGVGLQVTGSVSAAGIGAAGVPIAISIGGRSVGTVQTDGSGRFERSTAVGAADGPGDVPVEARLALQDRALSAAMATTPLAIERTATRLSVETTAANPTQLAVRGRLVTADGEPIAGQPIALRLNGTVIDEVRTGSDGSYQVRVAVPDGLIASSGNTTLLVGAAFEGADTNLRPANATAVAVLPPVPGGRQGRSRSPVARPATLGLAALIGLVLFGLIAGWWLLTVRSEGAVDAEALGHIEGTDDAVAPADGSTRPPLERARERLGVDADGAVVLAYEAIRSALTRADRSRHGRADTHWEFLATCRADGLDEAALDSLTQLTEIYEEAAFAPRTVTTARAEAALASGERLLAG